jgi:hypothetical protein
MIELNLPAATLGDFSVEANLQERAIQARFTGNADLRAREALEKFLVGLHAEAQRVAAEKVVVDFHRLEFMNSSCFKSFVTWIGEVQDLNADKQYRIHFRSNPEMLWQRRSLHALRCFAVDLITIEP